MLGKFGTFFRSLVGKRSQDCVGLAYIDALKPQLELLGFQFGGVPPELPYTSEKCRGALAGLSMGVLEAQGVNLDLNSLADSLVSVFVLVYSGEDQGLLALQTTMDIANKNMTLLDAAEWSRADYKGALESNGIASVIGFYSAATGMI